jgi:hypothetical protein
MRRLLLAIALLAGVGLAAAQDTAGIREVISRQIEAMRADDFDTAFGFASPGIQRKFGGPARFGKMVRDGYPMVWHPRAVRFLDVVTERGRTVQGVLVTDEAGALHVLDYDMVPLDGGWRIDGVRIRDGVTGGV